MQLNLVLDRRCIRQPADGGSHSSEAVSVSGWMRNMYRVLFERYADDIIHCSTKEESKQMLEELKGRMQELN